MLRWIKFLGLFAVVFNLTAVGFAQGTLDSVLAPDLGSTPPLAGFAVIDTPSTNGGGLTFPVSFQISINSDQVALSMGRIFGGSTAWAFDLGTPTTNGGTLFFTGTTEMEAFQINDMLADKTQLEVIDSVGFTADLVGPLVTVPEPSIMTLGCLAAIILLAFKILFAPLITHERAPSGVDTHRHVHSRARAGRFRR